MKAMGAKIRSPSKNIPSGSSGFGPSHIAGSQLWKSHRHFARLELPVPIQIYDNQQLVHVFWTLRQTAERLAEIAWNQCIQLPAPRNIRAKILGSPNFE
jgi:hypothetical protein